jgi:glucokinase
VVDGKADLTNARGWNLDEAALAAALGLRAVRLINDFAAPALAVPLLGPADLRPIGGTRLIDPSQTVSLLGPGTGTGVSARVVDRDQMTILVTEGGHIGFAPADQVEREVLRILSARFGRVSIERILCGHGIVNLHQALGEIEGRIVPELAPSDVTGAALAGDPAALATMERFFAILGTVAGDLALVHGARGGVLLAGGILPLVAGLLETSKFRARFEDKGRLSPLLQAIPTNLLVAQDVALLGAAMGR